MIKAGTTVYHRIKIKIDLAVVEAAVITYATYGGEKIIFQRRYPDEATAEGNMLVIPFTQEDTTKLLEDGGSNICCEVQINLRNGAVAKTHTKMMYVASTLATDFINGNHPSSDMPDNVYDFETDEIIYIKGDDGHTPYIGNNGNWWINREDTGKPAAYRLAAIDRGTALELKLVPDTGAKEKK